MRSLRVQDTEITVTMGLLEVDAIANLIDEHAQSKDQHGRPRGLSADLRHAQSYLRAACDVAAASVDEDDDESNDD